MIEEQHNFPNFLFKSYKIQCRQWFRNLRCSTSEGTDEYDLIPVAVVANGRGGRRGRPPANPPAPVLAENPPAPVQPAGLVTRRHAAAIPIDPVPPVAVVANGRGRRGLPPANPPAPIPPAPVPPAPVPPADVPPVNPPVAAVANRRGGGRRDRSPAAAAAASVDSDSENEGQEDWRQRMDRFFQRQDERFIMRRNEIMERRRREAIQRQMEEDEEDLALEVAEFEQENRNVPYLMFDREDFRAEDHQREDGTCSVCLVNRADQVLDSCRHVFCADCIQQLETRICPICRAHFVNFRLVDDNELAAGNPLLPLQ